LPHGRRNGLGSISALSGFGRIASPRSCSVPASGNQLYALNVFKVKEVLAVPQLPTLCPGLNPVVRWLAHIRGGTLPIIDLNKATAAGAE